MDNINAESVQMRILQQGWGVPESEEEYRFALETVRHADLLENQDFRFEARYMLCRAATAMNKYQVILDTFTQCITLYDRYPGRFSSTSMIWMYKYMLGNVNEFPGIDRQQILSLLADFRERLRAAGGSERTYWFFSGLSSMGFERCSDA